MRPAEPSGAATGEAISGRQRTGAAPSMDCTEQLLWTLMRKFERLALDRYCALAPMLATAEKRRFVAWLEELEGDDEALAASELARPAEELLERAGRAGGEIAVLIVQGLILEHLAQAIYRIAAGTERASASFRELGAAGRTASASTIAAASARIAERLGTHETLYAVFADVSHDTLGALDALAEPVDHVFGERFGLRFAELMGEFVADLITACTALGMQRRKVVAHLAGACMGL